MRTAGGWRVAGACAVLTLLASPLSGEIPAFPGAEGFGRYSCGGRGGRAIEVTNLNDEGPGSLRAAVEASGARTVIFRVSGTIHLRSPLVISRDSITIAGQTAPGDGICIADQTFSVQANHVIIRFLRFRLGDLDRRHDDDALNGCRNIQRGIQGPVIIDHCSASWSVDEAASFYDNRDFTLQWCFITESLDRSHHAKGEHGYGGIWGGQRATFHHNLFAHHTSRTPRFNGGRTTGEPEKELVDHRNNVIYNWGFNSAYGGEGGSYNIVGNYYKSGPATDGRVARRILQPFDETSTWHVAGNVVEGSPAVTADNWLGVDPGSGVDPSKIRRADRPFPSAPITEQTAEEAYALVLEQAGATLPRRDTVDRRIVAEVRSGSATYGGSHRVRGARGGRSGIIDSQSAVGGWPELKSAPPPADSDHDGMPDEWEARHGLNGGDPSDGPALTAEGYSNLEIYLEALVGGPTLFLIGDSTMAEKPLIGNPERGWGMAFSAFLKEGVRVENHAKNGRSTRSFIREGRWDSVLRAIRPGDYVLIQFGHNDAKVTDTNRYAAPRAGYRENLLRFVHEARGKGGIPILLTPVARRRFSDGKVVDSHAEYSAVVKEIGREESLSVIDLDSLSMDLLAAAGEEESKGLYLWLRGGVLSRLDTGRIDNTHFSSRGARAIAGLVASDVRRQGLPLGELLGQNPPPALPPEKSVLLDCFYNNEWRPDQSGKPVRFHYVWHDTTNSGFSILAELITDAGACIDTLCQAPTELSLRRASVYVIVDPDTPKESPAPNTIQRDAVRAVARWVEEGGVLLLLGNDRGNAEFQQWNLLAREFGIQFREESLARVVGKEYGIGTFDNLPNHPVFRGVRRIFLKEISPLTLSGGATPLLESGGAVIMAVAGRGKGLVLAVGDPWLYNEYIDTRRLPPGYDNARAGENLFRWLLEQAPSVSWR